MSKKGKYTTDDLVDHEALHNNPNALRPKYFEARERKGLVDRFTSGTASLEDMKFVADLMRDPEQHTDENLYIPISRWWRDIEEIEDLMSDGRYRQAYKKIAQNLKEGQSDLLFQRFAGEIFDEISEFKQLPKRGSSPNLTLSQQVYDAFILAKKNEIQGQQKIELMEEKFNKPYKTLESIFTRHKKELEEVSRIESEMLSAERNVN